ncbi:unnamed protein product, partial [Urochloa humidicola]
TFLHSAHDRSTPQTAPPTSPSSSRSPTRASSSCSPTRAASPQSTSDPASTAWSCAASSGSTVSSSSTVDAALGAEHERGEGQEDLREQLARGRGGGEPPRDVEQRIEQLRRKAGPGERGAWGLDLSAEHLCGEEVQVTHARLNLLVPFKDN